MAFYAVVSIGVIGLYVAFAIPIWFRWRAGDRSRPGPWTLGNRYKWMNIVAVAEIVITSVYFLLPFTPTGWPGTPDFTWTAVNYTPIVVLAPCSRCGSAGTSPPSTGSRGHAEPWTCLPASPERRRSASSTARGVPQRRARPPLTPLRADACAQRVTRSHE